MEKLYGSEERYLWSKFPKEMGEHWVHIGGKKWRRVSRDKFVFELSLMAVLFFAGLCEKG